MKTIIAAFCDQAAADSAIAYLQQRGVTDLQQLGTPSTTGTNYLTGLSAFNLPDDKAQLYAEVARRGAIVIAAHTDHDAREMARDLDKMGSLDLDAAAKRWRKAGWDGYDINALPYDANACATERSELLRESAVGVDGVPARDLDVIEEKVNIGKREVDRGGVRVRTFVQERPVRENVKLTEERVDVRRERVDEPIAPGALDATMKEDEFVVTARGEEAVVGKEARVVERVHVGKTADTRTEKIEETERRRDVEVKPIEGTETRHRPRH
jgi:hypothetical protein